MEESDHLSGLPRPLDDLQAFLISKNPKVVPCADEAAGGGGLMALCPLAMAVLLEREQAGSLRSSQEALIKGSP
ncbi:hypothetical protein QQF64_005818 [Cirrhinus molitorella]|uniref:Uncharacterized protein n=1 Tax=Cirrhinus molitorella TaxID=172907 RepID=A0ABR3MGF8_9TELE